MRNGLKLPFRYFFDSAANEPHLKKHRKHVRETCPHIVGNKRTSPGGLSVYSVSWPVKLIFSYGENKTKQTGTCHSLYATETYPEQIKQLMFSIAGGSFSIAWTKPLMRIVIKECGIAIKQKGGVMAVLNSYFLVFYILLLQEVESWEGEVCSKTQWINYFGKWTSLDGDVLGQL